MCKFDIWICYESIVRIRVSMTSLLTHSVAHSTRPSFRPKINNQPLKKFLSLALSWTKVVPWKKLFLKKNVSLKKLLFLFSQKDTYLAFQFLFPSVLLSCYHHLKAKNGMYFCPSIFEHFRMVWDVYSFKEQNLNT